jgi:hypothetical protein
MLTFDALQPALECPEVSEHQQIFLQVTYALPNRCDVTGEIAYNGIRSYADEWRNSIGVPESRFDMQDFLIQFAELFLQDRVVVLQPVFADIVDRVLIDVFKFELQFQQLQQIVIAISLVHPLHQPGLALALVRIRFTIGMKGTRKFAIDLADGLA